MSELEEMKGILTIIHSAYKLVAEKNKREPHAKLMATQLRLHRAEKFIKEYMERREV